MRLIEEVDLNNPVCSKMPEVGAQLTPSGKELECVCVTDDHRPHNPFGLPPGFVPVTDT